MKMQTTFFALIALVILSLSACKDDEETKKNSFKYNQKEAEIGTALGFAYGQTEVNSVYWIAMEFFEKSFTVHYSNGYPDSLSGKGDAMLITFLTNKETEISPGVYNVKLSSAAYTAFSIDGEEETGLIVGYDAASNNEPPYIEIISGKVTVAKNSDEYEFTFDLTTNINSNITGYYKGKPVIYQDKKKKSTASQSWFPLKQQHN